jgi:hypothetical protein
VKTVSLTIAITAGIWQHNSLFYPEIITNDITFQKTEPSTEPEFKHGIPPAATSPPLQRSSLDNPELEFRMQLWQRRVARMAQ